MWTIFWKHDLNLPNPLVQSLIPLHFLGPPHATSKNPPCVFSSIWPLQMQNIESSWQSDLNIFFVAFWKIYFFYSVIPEYTYNFRILVSSCWTISVIFNFCTISHVNLKCWQKLVITLFLCSYLWIKNRNIIYYQFYSSTFGFFLLTYKICGDNYRNVEHAFCQKLKISSWLSQSTGGQEVKFREIERGDQK